MIDRALLARVKIEPLDRKKHDRAAFTCGECRIDNFLRISASGQQDNEITRVQVACLDDDVAVVGFYALNTHGIDVTSLPDAVRKKLPHYNQIGSIYLSMVGVHTNHQGGGLGQLLMKNAFQRCVEIANMAGAHFVILDAVNERAARLYRRLGFEDLPGHSPRMLIAMKTVRRAIELAAQPAVLAK